MTNINKYKPRYTLSHLTKTKVWPYKDGYLRGFYRIRSRRIKPKGNFRKYVIVAKSMKWTEARNFFRPNTRRIGKKLMFGKSAYGRPQASSRRYSNLFYIKQKLRAFHGKVKEDAFRNLFKNHLIQIAVQTNSFFSVLESRLDRIFFRIRLLPTIFACHQFIHYKGLEINHQLEKSPRKEVKIGDIITVPAQAWIAFYWNVYYRIYYRRWGMYIFKRRLIKKIKKKLFFDFNIKNKTFQIKKLYQYKSNHRVKPKYYMNKVNSLKNFMSSYRVSKEFPESISNIAESGNINVIITENNFGMVDALYNITAELKKKLNSFEASVNKQKNKEKIEKLERLFVKVKQYQKLYFNSYFFSTWKQKRNMRSSNISQSFFKKKQKSLLWLFWKRLKKQKRKKAIIRLKPVHFFIPAYLQMDFRTLSAIKRKTPSYSEMHYPFQISLPKTYSFYKSQGF
jgi:ribosomal protein S4